MLLGLILCFSYGIVKFNDMYDETVEQKLIQIEDRIVKSQGNIVYKETTTQNSRGHHSTNYTLVIKLDNGAEQAFDVTHSFYNSHSGRITMYSVDGVYEVTKERLAKEVMEFPENMASYGLFGCIVGVALSAGVMLILCGYKVSVWFRS